MTVINSKSVYSMKRKQESNQITNKELIECYCIRLFSWILLQMHRRMGCYVGLIILLTIPYCGMICFSSLGESLDLVIHFTLACVLIGLAGGEILYRRYQDDMEEGQRQFQQDIDHVNTIIKGSSRNSKSKR